MVGVHRILDQAVTCRCHFEAERITPGERVCVRIPTCPIGAGGPADGIRAVDGLDPVPALATGCTANADLTVWTCTLRDGVTFHDGSTFDASDVIVSFAAQWDALSPLHLGNTGLWTYWGSLIGGGFLNKPGPCGLSNTPACPVS